MNGTMCIYVTDKTGRQGWRTTVGIGFHAGELANVGRSLALVKAGKVRGMDAASARLVCEVDGVEIDPATLQPRAEFTHSDADLLAELGV